MMHKLLEGAFLDAESSFFTGLFKKIMAVLTVYPQFHDTLAFNAKKTVYLSYIFENGITNSEWP